MADFIHSLIASGKPWQQNASVSICSRAGINLLSKEKIKLEAMVDGLKYVVDELSSAKSRVEFSSAALLGLRLVKANCDAFISLAADATDAIATFAPAFKPMAKGARAVSDSYSTAQTVIGIGTMAQDGQVDVKGLNKLSAKHTKKLKGVKHLHANVNIVTDAMRQDYKALQKDIAGFAYDVHKDASKLLVISSRKGGYLSKEGARALGSAFKAVDAAKSAVSTASDYSNSLEKAFDERIADEDFIRDLASQAKTAANRLRAAQGRLIEVNKALNECYSNMDPEVFSTHLL